MIGENIIGPYLLPTNLNGHTYLRFLEDVLEGDLLEDLPLQLRGDENTFRTQPYQRGGAPYTYIDDTSKMCQLQY